MVVAVAAMSRPCGTPTVAALAAILITGSGCDRSDTSTPPTHQAAQPVHPLLVKIDTTVSGGAFPIVNGTTNLPDGTILLLVIMACQVNNVNNPEANCSDPSTSPWLAHPGDGQNTWQGLPKPKGGTCDFCENPVVKNGRFGGHPWTRQDGEGFSRGPMPSK
jgi:hypothetical protein